MSDLTIYYSPQRPVDDIAPIQLSSATDAVYDILRQQILNGRLAPGQRLDMPQLEKQLGVSRSPLKDAINRLASDGVVEVQSRRGTFVTPLSDQRLRENFEVRAVLASGACPLIIERATEDEIRDVERMLSQMTAFVERPDWQSQLPAYLVIDREFHHRIIGMAHNERLTELYEQNTIYLVIARIRHFYTRAEVMESHQDHVNITRALAERDAEALRYHADTHIKRAYEAALKNLERERDAIEHKGDAEVSQLIGGHTR